MNEEMIGQANTKIDWVAATRNMEISAYPIYKTAISETFTRHTAENNIKQISWPAILLASEEALKQDWDTPEEDEAWSNL